MTCDSWSSPRAGLPRDWEVLLSAMLLRAWRSVVTVAVLVTAAACGRSEPARDAVPAAARPAAAARAGYDGDLPPLPVVQFASARPAPLTRAAYEFAARHPEVLKHIPCFCGCERNGHGNNGDCFVARREADGRPEWSPHGIGCGICIDVARGRAADARGGRERRRYPPRDRCRSTEPSIRPARRRRLRTEAMQPMRAHEAFRRAPLRDCSSRSTKVSTSAPSTARRARRSPPTRISS